MRSEAKWTVRFFVLAFCFVISSWTTEMKEKLTVTVALESPWIPLHGLEMFEISLWALRKSLNVFLSLKIPRISLYGLRMLLNSFVWP